MKPIRLKTDDCFLNFPYLIIHLPPIVRVVAQPGSALVWGASGRWFESSPPDFFLLFGSILFIFGM
jgi:hypothetical protein